MQGLKNIAEGQSIEHMIAETVSLMAATLNGLLDMGLPTPQRAIEAIPRLNELALRNPGSLIHYIEALGYNNQFVSPYKHDFELIGAMPNDISKGSNSISIPAPGGASTIVRKYRLQKEGDIGRVDLNRPSIHLVSMYDVFVEGFSFIDMNRKHGAVREHDTVSNALQLFPPRDIMISLWFCSYYEILNTIMRRRLLRNVGFYG